MRQLQSVRTSFTKKSTLNWLLLIGFVWLIAASVLWWQIVYTDPKNVFNGMLKNNLSTVGYTHVTDSTQGQLKAHETAQAQFGFEPLVRTLTQLKQEGDVVLTDAISTPDKEFVRYKVIKTQSKTPDGKAIDFSKAVGVWASSPNNGSSQTLTQAALGIFPMGNVPPNERAELLEFLNTHTVFSVKYDKAKKQTINGRQVYTYNVQLLPQAYIEMLKQYGQAVGLGSQVESLNPADYADAQPTDLKVSVDILSRHLTSISYSSNATRKENFSGYGITKNVALPSKTIATSELQQRLSGQ